MRAPDRYPTLTEIRSNLARSIARERAVDEEMRRADARSGRLAERESERAKQKRPATSSLRAFTDDDATCPGIRSVKITLPRLRFLENEDSE